MYAHINGIVEEVRSDRAIIEACGIGYELICSGNTLKLLHPGEQTKLYTHFNLSQDSISLYGFYSDAEREMFRKLTSVSRIGPKAALSVLTTLSPEDVALAIMTDNAAAFDNVRGLSRKTAERVILELKGKIKSDNLVSVISDTATVSHNSMRTEAISALVALGYDGNTAGRTVATLGEYQRVEDMIMAALRELSK